MKYIVDRIEGDFAVCEAEDQSMIDIALSELPANLKEGDNLAFTDGLYEIMQPDLDRKERINKLMDDLWG